MADTVALSTLTVFFYTIGSGKFTWYNPHVLMAWTVVGTPESSTILYNKFRAIVLTTACVFHVATAPFAGSHAVRLYCLIATTQQRLLQPLSGKHLKNTRVRSKKIVNLTTDLYISSRNSFLSKFSSQIRWTQLFRLEIQNAIGINSSYFSSHMYSSRSATSAVFCTSCCMLYLFVTENNRNVWENRKICTSA
jgi:hypothetical protein